MIEIIGAEIQQEVARRAKAAGLYAVWGAIVKLPQRSPGCTGSLAESGFWCILSLKGRMWYVTKIAFLTFL